MDRYVTGDVIRKLRENKKLTQEELAEKIYVSAKAVSKWETGKGFPDICLLEPLAKTLGISVIELMSGNTVQNKNQAADMLKSKIYVCPVCGNVIQATGETLISCCGITLPPSEAETPDKEHRVQITIAEDEYHVSLHHPMTKDHYISFLSAASDMGWQTVKLYPEGSAEARFKIGGIKTIYAYCNRHGLYKAMLPVSTSP